MCCQVGAKLPESSKFVVALRGNGRGSAVRAGDDRSDEAGGWRVVGSIVGRWMGRSAAGRDGGNRLGRVTVRRPCLEPALGSGSRFWWPTRVLRFRCGPGENLPC